MNDGCAQEMKEGQVSVELARLAEEIQRGSNIQVDIRTRLKLVTYDEPVPCSECEGVTEKTLCGMAEVVRKLRREIAETNDNYIHLLNTIEL